jgi:amino acid adenylation domain-containing protein
MTSSIPCPHPSAQEMVCFPASFAQQSLWFLDQLNPGKATYNIPSALRVRGDLDADVLKTALTEIVRRHETLRTRFVAVHGEPQQVVDEHVDLHLVVLDLTLLPAAEQREAEGMRLAREEAQTPFDLKQAPLFRAKLLRLGPRDHVLLFTMHHIVSDGWSVGVLIEEVSVLYEAFRAGKPSPLSELPIQYADYSVWQQKWLQDGGLEEQLAYWKRQLHGSSMLMLPGDRSRSVQSQNGKTRDFVIEAQVTRKLKGLAEEQGTSLFMVLLAAFQILLGRYSGQHDIAVGTPVAGRDSETEKLIGYFINTLVLRADLSGRPSFIELLHKTKDVALEAYAHQDVPFQKLVEALAPERNLASTPLFQVMFSLQNAPRGDLRLGPALLQPFDAVDNGTAKFDLTLLQAEDGSGRLASSLQYSTDLFEAATIDRLVGHYEHLLTSIISAPHASVHSLEILRPQERRILLEDFNRTASPVPETTVARLFEEQADRTPEALAVQYGEESLSYMELDRRASQLAHYLIRTGAGPETLVGVCLNRSVSMIVALLGILKSGAAYVPLDPSYPTARLSFMLEDSQAPVLITESSLRSSFAGHAVRTISMDQDWNDICSAPISRVESRADGSNLAYVIYTSGSTGRSKGVGVTHKGMINYVTWAGRTYGTGQSCGSPLHSSLAFDLTITSIFPALTAGGYIDILPQSAGMEEMAQRLQHSDYSVLKLTPSHLRMLSMLLEQSGKGRNGAHALVIGGEALRYADLDIWRTPGSKTRLINEYGPTETVVGSTIYEVQDERPAGDAPIGKPIANTEIYVLDRDMQPVPSGLPGELYIAGSGLARGYINRPSLTAACFVPNPYGSPGARMYRTGDLARWRRDGNLEYLGRNDHQVKIRGFRIELGEIEAALEQHPEVAQAVVLVREGQGDEKRLVAYVVKKPGANLENASGLEQYLKTVLPGYMVPAAFSQLEQWPLNPNGKIDRKSLPQPDLTQQEYTGPRNPIEETLCWLWEEVLQRERVGVHNNFFEIGGHSLLATRVTTRIRETLKVNVPLRQMFESPTIAQLAGVIDQAVQAAGRNGAPSPALPEIKRVARKAALLQ